MFAPIGAVWTLRFCYSDCSLHFRHKNEKEHLWRKSYSIKACKKKFLQSEKESDIF